MKSILILIFVIFIAACIETDIYLPAFPDMMVFFSATEDEIKSSHLNFIGICISGPFYGPISDASWQKKPLMAALGYFCWQYHKHSLLIAFPGCCLADFSRLRLWWLLTLGTALSSMHFKESKLCAP